jgi:hypothetical protein
MYEDADVELDAFARPGRIFCIASAGSTAFRLADRHDVVACDVNPVQLDYARRRAEGAPEKPGDVERAMEIARTFLPIVGWHESVLRAFLALSNLDEQVAFWTLRLDTRRFRAGFDATMSRALLRTVYAPRFLDVLPARLGPVLRARLARGFARHRNATNPYARTLLLGESADEHRPRASAVRFVLGDAAGVLESSPPGSFDGFALSNILDGADRSYRARLACAVRRAAAPDAVVVVRSFAEPPVELVVNHAARDRSMLWGIVDIAQAERFGA